jgi:hypothetical protein
MYEPSTVIVYKPPLVICRFESADYHGPVPWIIRLNPLRYSITFLRRDSRRWSINKDGRWYIRAANLLFRLRNAVG